MDQGLSQQQQVVVSVRTLITSYGLRKLAGSLIAVITARSKA